MSVVDFPHLDFLIPGTSFLILCRWNLDSGLQLLVGFRIAWAVFRNWKPRIPESISKNCPKSGMRIHEHGAISFTAEMSTFTSLTKRVGILPCLSILTSSIFFLFHQDKCELIRKGRSLTHRNILEASIYSRVTEYYRLTLNCRDLYLETR